MQISTVESTKEQFWKDLEPLIFDQDRLQNAAEECRTVLAMLGAGAGSRILDIGCGVGRHANHLSSLGHHVEGIDKIPHLIMRAKSAGSREGAPIFHIGDVARYQDYTVDVFDYAICFYHSLGFNPDPAEDLMILERVHECLRPGGRLFIELIDPDGFAPGQKLAFDSEIGGRKYSEIIQITRDLDFYELKVQDRRIPNVVYQARHRLFSRSKIENMLKTVGFRVDWPQDGKLTGYANSSRKFCVIGGKV